MQKSDSKETTTCFECLDNKLNCGVCDYIEKCSGCEICHTHHYEPCIHCKIECFHEQSCMYRKKWEGEIMKKKNIKNKSDKLDEIPCYTCELKECSISGMCPHGVLDTPAEYLDLYRGTTVITTKPKKYNTHGKVWDTGITCIDDCHHKSEKIKLCISLDTYLKLEHLQKAFADVEFLVYANAELQTDGAFLIKDIIIPKQTVGMASVDDVQCDNHFNTVIHKHPGDAPGGFSRDDEEYVNMNHDFSLLIGSKNLSNVIGVGRKKTDCGRWIRIPLDIDINVPEISDTFFLSSVNNIEKKKFTQTVYGSYPRNNKWDKQQKEVDEWYKNRFY